MRARCCARLPGRERRALGRGRLAAVAAARAWLRRPARGSASAARRAGGGRSGRAAGCAAAAARRPPESQAVCRGHRADRRRFCRPGARARGRSCVRVLQGTREYGREGVRLLVSGGIAPGCVRGHARARNGRGPAFPLRPNPTYRSRTRGRAMGAAAAAAGSDSAGLRTVLTVRRRCSRAVAAPKSTRPGGAGTGRGKGCLLAEMESLAGGGLPQYCSLELGTPVQAAQAAERGTQRSATRNATEDNIGAIIRAGALEPGLLQADRADRRRRSRQDHARAPHYDRHVHSCGHTPYNVPPVVRTP